MKQILGLGLLLVAITGLNLKHVHEATYPAVATKSFSYPAHEPLDNVLNLTFDYAGPAKNIIYDFSVRWNDVQVFRKTVNSTDKEIHHASVSVTAKVGTNALRFVGETEGNTGINIANIKLVRNSFCGYEDLIVNGKLEGLTDFTNKYQVLTEIKGWKGIPELEVGVATIYNTRWPAGSYAFDLTSGKKISVEQTIEFDQYFRVL